MAEANDVKSNGGENAFRKVYDDTAYFIDSIIEEYKIFPAILQMMRDGNATIELKKRYILRAIDETWVNIVEDTLPALDTIIRTPSKTLEEREEILPIELSRNISVRSLQHLSQHTNMISKIDGDKITPSKILNIFRDETYQTYENKFINTLISRLFTFVNRRYEIALRAGQDEKTTGLTFNEEFYHNSAKVKINFSLEIAESTEDSEDRPKRNYTHTTDLWKRVKRLNSIVSTYAASEFVQNMGHSYIRPPVMRTNAILKNKNMRQCLALWQFIEGYDNAGYSMLVEEDLEKVDDEYIKELYSTIALQYLIFRFNVKNEFDANNTLDSSLTENELRPRIISELEKLKDADFDVDIPDEKLPKMPSLIRFENVTPEDKMMQESIETALEAAKIMHESGFEDYVEEAAITEPEPVERPFEEPEEEELTAEEEDAAVTDEPENDADSDEDTAEDAITKPRTPIDDFSDQIDSLILKLREKDKLTDELSKEMEAAMSNFKNAMKLEENRQRLAPIPKEIKKINRAKRRARRKAHGKG